jgi:hypothetical protein
VNLTQQTLVAAPPCANISKNTLPDNQSDTTPGGLLQTLDAGQRE